MLSRRQAQNWVFPRPMVGRDGRECGEDLAEDGERIVFGSRAGVKGAIGHTGVAAAKAAYEWSGNGKVASTFMRSPSRVCRCTWE
jgi:hypothetical protein